MKVRLGPPIVRFSDPPDGQKKGDRKRDRHIIWCLINNVAVPEMTGTADSPYGRPREAFRALAGGVES
jgi:hypothetical protein